MKLNVPVNARILNDVAGVDHFRGVWADGAVLPPGRRRSLAARSRIASTVAACRLAGLRFSEEEVTSLIDGEATPDGEGREVLGYHRVLSEPLPEPDRLLDTTEIRRLHAVLLGAPDGEVTPSPWRETPCDPEAFDASGRAIGRVFVTLPHRLVPETMEDLTTWVEYELRSREHHALLVIATFALGVLAANPFLRGNLRVALALTTRMLEMHGYGFVRFASLEAILDGRREALYDAFDVSQTRIWSGEANLEPWLVFFMEVLQEHALQVGRILDEERRETRFSRLQQDIVRTVRKHGTAEAGLLIRELGTNRNTLKDNLRRLVDRGVLEKMGERRGTRYRLASPEAERIAEP